MDSWQVDWEQLANILMRFLEAPVKYVEIVEEVPRKCVNASYFNTLTTTRRERWIDAINREDITESMMKYGRVCSRHFISGKPAPLGNVNAIDWVPTQNMGHVGCVSKRQCSFDRQERPELRKKMMIEMPVEVVYQEDCEEPITSTSSQAGSDLTGSDIDDQFGSTKVEKLAEALVKSMLTFDNLKHDNVKCNYYTGFDFPVLEIIFNEISEFIPTSPVNFLEPFQQFLIAFIKLRLNLPIKDIAYRFGISDSTCLSYFRMIIECMYKRFRTLIIWPEYEVINKNVPRCFKEVFLDETTMIVDCFEIIIEKPPNYLTQQQSWSNNKRHHTVKFLIVITPQGTISYISEAWGGRTTDKQLVEKSGLLHRINPNDVILASKGFSLATLETKKGFSAFEKGDKQQLDLLKIGENKRMIQLGIEIDRMIKLIKSKFLILNGPLPINMLVNDADNANLCEKIVVVCSALINLSKPVLTL